MAEVVSRSVAPISIKVCHQVNTLFKKLPTEINLQILKLASDEPARVIQLFDQLVKSFKDPGVTRFLNLTDIDEIKAVQSAIPKLSRSGFPVLDKHYLIDPNQAPQHSILTQKSRNNPLSEYWIDEPTKFDTSRLTSAYAKVYAKAAEEKSASQRQSNRYYADLSQMTINSAEARILKARAKGMYQSV